MNRISDAWRFLNSTLLFIFLAMNFFACQDAGSGNFAETIEVPAGLQIPPGMIYIPGGETEIGTENGMPDERPVFTVEITAFFIDKHPVTVAQFREFVEATGFVTEAEKFGNAGVLNPDTHTWELRDGATWHHPRGPKLPAAPDDHPVTQVSWRDAVAYCEWAGKRLPTEAEWEHAARFGHSAQDRFAWGDEIVENDQLKANFWQGRFPVHNEGIDGYLLTSPVGAFGENVLGLTDMGGNVWEWTADWYRPYTFRNQPFEPDSTSEKAQRGGSFLCDPNVCFGFRVTSRSHSTPETSLMHVGFRPVMDIPK
ncbi:MAG: formylglycine-generating enzyme family protein [Deferribacteres bacterium]|nr:formylglycine-generating enzyme family protein [Deferribacteres bacterium]